MLKIMLAIIQIVFCCDVFSRAHALPGIYPPHHCHGTLWLYGYPSIPGICISVGYVNNYIVMFYCRKVAKPVLSMVLEVFLWPYSNSKSLLQISVFSLFHHAVFIQKIDWYDYSLHTMTLMLNSSSCFLLKLWCFYEWLETISQSLQQPTQNHQYFWCRNLWEALTVKNDLFSHLLCPDISSQARRMQSSGRANNSPSTVINKHSGEIMKSRSRPYWGQCCPST